MRDFTAETRTIMAEVFDKVPRAQRGYCLRLEKVIRSTIAESDRYKQARDLLTDDLNKARWAHSLTINTLDRVIPERDGYREALEQVIAAVRAVWSGPRLVSPPEATKEANRLWAELQTAVMSALDVLQPGNEE